MAYTDLRGMHDSKNNTMCSLSLAKANFREYFVNAFYFLLFCLFLKFKRYQFKIKRDKMNFII